MITQETRTRLIAVCDRIPCPSEQQIGPYKIESFLSKRPELAHKPGRLFILLDGNHNHGSERHAVTYVMEEDVMTFADWASNAWLTRLAVRLENAFPVMGIVVAQAVHYVAYNNRHLAATIIGVEDASGLVDLAIHTNMPNVNGRKSFGLQYHQDVPYSPMPRPGTWHRVE